MASAAFLSQASIGFLIWKISLSDDSSEVGSFFNLPAQRLFL